MFDIFLLTLKSWRERKDGGFTMIKNLVKDSMPRMIDSLAFPAILFSIIYTLFLWNTPAVLGGETRTCAEDIARFCKDVRPGGGRLISCLKRNESELTSVCKDKLQEVQKRLEDAKRACANDIEKFCRGVQEGEGRIARCLGEHSAELSPKCAEQVEWVKAKVKKHEPR